MGKRLWIAMAAGALVGAGAVAGFGPCVRSQLASRAAAYGAEVEVDRVVPGWSGVRLRGVEVAIEELPAVRVHIDSVIVGWTGARTVEVSGGQVRAVGELPELLDQFDRWRSRHLKGGSGSGGGGRRVDLQGFVVDWRDRSAEPRRRVTASGVSIGRGPDGLRVNAAELRGSLDGATLDMAGGRIVLVRHEGAYRVAELGSDALTIEVHMDGSNGLAASAEPAPLEGPVGPSPGGAARDLATAPPPSTARPTASPGPTPAGPTTSAPATPAPGSEHPRVRAARRAHRAMVLVAQQLGRVFSPEANTSLAGVRGVVRVRDDVLNLGPGTLSFAREEDTFVVSLAPSGAEPSQGEALTFGLRVPLPAAGTAAKRPVVAEVHGGPVWLSTLGVREGDFGLQGVAQASLEADATLTLPADGRQVTIDGRGKLRKLAVASKRLAAEPLRGIELAWRAKATAHLDGQRLEVAEGEIDLGDIHLLVTGSYDRSAEHHRVDLRFEVPLVPCQQAFDSLPKALVPKLEGMRFAGTLALKGWAKFDTARLQRSFDVNWDSANSCRVTEMPSELHADRFRSSFRKIVYTPDGQTEMATFGPGTDHWTPYASIARYMEGSVLVTEDGRFFRHHGFDQEAIVNSIRENIKARRFIRGASTISMQLARNLYLGREKTISRKLQEAVLTTYIEQEFTKQELMELYLNVIEYGPMVYGIGPAARHYYNSSPSRLSLGQAMYLASILPDPKKQHFGAGGAVSHGWTRYLRQLMKVMHKIHRITDEELEHGLRETVIFGASAPMVAPPEDPETDVYAEQEQEQGQAGDPGGPGPAP